MKILFSLVASADDEDQFTRAAAFASSLDKFSQRLAGQKHRIKISTQLRLDTDLGDDGGFHCFSVVHLHYMFKRCE